MPLIDQSLRNLVAVHSDLIRVVHRCMVIIDSHPTTIDPTFNFVVIEGARSLTRQLMLKRGGAVATKKSRLIPSQNKCKLSCGIHVRVTLDGDTCYQWPLYQRLARFMLEASVDEQVPIEWGGEWKIFQDGTLYQLPKKEYP